MKFLKYLLYVILALILIFLALGIFKSSISYGHEIKVDKPLKEAWAVSQDASKYDKWLKGFKSIELISGEQNEVGSKYKVIVNPGEGQPDFEMTETIISLEEFDHVTLDFDSDMMDFVQTINFSEEDGKTVISSDSKVIGKGIITRSMLASMEMLMGAFTAQEAENFEALKVLINENTTDYYPAPVEEVTEDDEVETEGD
ncbi:MAG: hypothetical protein HKO66_13070 [Saprospiraceae bacterium]|nr:hypothetical protein [Bacteroidia bacterium]NNL93164.1 hypothetical protein [Saprospiraceae bacterium]